MLHGHEVARMREAGDARIAAERALELRASDPAYIEYAAERLGGGWLIYCGPESTWTEALGLGMEGPVSDRELDALVGFFVARGATARVTVSSYAHPSVVRGLGVRGFVIADWEHVLVHELGADVWAEWPHARPPDLALEVVDVRDEVAVRAHAEVATSGFREPGQLLTDEMLAVHGTMLRVPGTVGLLARVGGEVAGAAAMNVADGVATLFGASVVPALRRRGVQAELIAARLERARAAGALVACIHSRPGWATERNAQRLGFRMVYSRALMVRPANMS